MPTKKEIAGIVAVLAVVGLLVGAIEKFIKWYHWLIIEPFNMISYSPYLIVTSLIAFSVYWIITLVKKPHWYYYAVGVVWALHEVIWLYSMYMFYWA